MAIEEIRLLHDRRLAMAMLALFLIPSLWYFQTDLQLFGGDPARLTLRLIVRGLMVAVAFAALIALASVHSRAAYSRVVLATGLALATALLVINALRPEYSDLPLRSPLFTIAVMYGLLPNSTIRQILPPLLLSVGLIILRLAWLSSAANADVAGDVLILIVLNTAGVLMVLRRRALERALDRAWQGQLDARLASDRAMAELRTLHGIIPICSFCKKVRTEIGSWQQIERYVQQHSHAEFSHGVCPECRDTHYAEFSPDQTG
jgi:hypothetical protein